ncbi:conserved protein of unknown function [Methylocella tundrae]|uniref:Protein YebE n=1 Tax=Methylocella tundrae TaxID=227605 RepID=A0A4U8YXB7_METTU|nr:DUF533 domain-containing protein [Methylocella tundrae]VFU08099.1 conserved protein of unknown function [Methylocella tundrae]
MFDAKQLLDMLAGGRLGQGGDAAVASVNDAIERGKSAASDAASVAMDATTQAANQTASTLSSVLGEAEAQLQGTQAAEYVGKAKTLVEQNPVGTLATLGGLAALMLGTQGGRAATGGLVKLGGLAAIGGIAYKALRNYQEGKPLTQGVPGLEQLTAAPEETAFGAGAHTHDTALLLVRTMVATAAADGDVDAGQRAQIVGELKNGGLDAEAVQFLENEIHHPASAADIAAAVGSSKELALQTYAAAQLVARSAPEKAFLQSLAQALALDPALIAHIDATATALAPPAK